MESNHHCLLFMNSITQVLQISCLLYLVRWHHFITTNSIPHLSEDCFHVLLKCESGNVQNRAKAQSVSG